MDIKELENIMISHGIVLRAIPKIERSICEKRRANEFPDGKIEYLEEYKREMLVIERIPKYAGKFIFEYKQGTASTVKFTGKKFFDSIEQAVNDLLGM